MIVILMGVAGAGKTTVGTALARLLGWRFVDGDDLHPTANRQKIARGEPLDDADRAPWLDALGTLIADLDTRSESAVLACSALRQSYRDMLTACSPRVLWVYLRADPALVRARLAARRVHFATPAILESQFAALEEPAQVLTMDASLPSDVLVESIVSALARQTPKPAESTAWKGEPSCSHRA
jgi:gluconokinase